MGMAGNAEDETLAVERVIDAVERRALACLAAELDLTPSRIERRPPETDDIVIRDLTAIVAAGPPVNLYIAFSFGDALLVELTRSLTAGLENIEEDEGTLREAVAGEVANLVVGHCTADLAGRGEAIILSPPILLGPGTIIYGSTGSRAVAHLTLTFDAGVIEITLVRPGRPLDLIRKFKGID